MGTADLTIKTISFTKTLDKTKYSAFAIGLYTSVDGWGFSEFPIAFVDSNMIISKGVSLGDNTSFYLGVYCASVTETGISFTARVSSGNSTRDPSFMVYGII